MIIGHRRIPNLYNVGMSRSYVYQARSEQRERKFSLGIGIASREKPAVGKFSGSIRFAVIYGILIGIRIIWICQTYILTPCRRI